MKCIVVTPEKTILNQEASFVVVPLFDGEYGVAPKHTPVIGRIGAGELRITTLDNTVEKWFIEGGFVEIMNDDVSVLTQKAQKSDDLDPIEAKKLLDSLLHPTAGSMPVINRELAINNARVKVHIANKSK